MELVLVSDLHSNKKAILYLEEIAKRERPDGLIICGDITTYGEIEYLRSVFSIVKKFKMEGFVIWGNADSDAIRQMILASPYNSHLRLRIFAAEKIYGLSYSDEPILPTANDIKDSIFITHQPPVKSAISKKFSNAPKYHISGHLHDKKWTKRYPSTTHIQVPTLQSGEYAVFEPEDGSLKFKSIL